jgi:hypothetical protein
MEVCWKKQKVKTWRDCARSSRVKRSDGSRTKRGLVFNWPAPRPVRVMGMPWTAGLIVGMAGLAHLAVTRWWTTKGIFATKLRDTEEELLRVTVRKWGCLLVHVFDRGYASGYWLGVLATYRARFVIRWIKNHVFLTSSGEEKKLWQIGQGKMYLAHKEIRDPMTGEKMPCDLWWCAVRHPSSEEPLYLLKARVKQAVMYLITNEPVKTEAQAWEVVFPYRRRWQIEVSFRYAKCELALECPRLWSLEARRTAAWHGHAGLCLPAFLARSAASRTRESPFALQMPPHRKTLPADAGTALPAPLGTQSPLGRLPSSPDLFHPPFR